MLLRYKPSTSKYFLTFFVTGAREIDAKYVQRTRKAGKVLQGQ